MPVEAFVQHQEAAKERVSALADQIAQGVDFERIKVDPHGYAAALLADMFALLEEEVLIPLIDLLETDMVAMGFDSVPDLADAVTAAIADVEQAIADQLEAALDDIDKQIDDIYEVSQEAGDRALEAGSAFEQTAIATIAAVLATGADDAVGDLTEAVSTSYIEASAAAGEPLRWVTVMDQRVCEGDIEDACDPRHGLVKTLDEWQNIGLPRAANLNCSVWNGAPRCRCVLVQTKLPVAGPVVVPRSR